VDQSLFRQEALEFQRQRHTGEIVLVRPVSFSLLTAIAVAIALATIGFAFWGEYTRKAHVQGYLAPSRGLIKVYPPEAGTLIEKEVLDPICTEQGYAIIRVLSLSPASLDEKTRSTIKKILFEDWLAERRRGSKTEWYWGNTERIAQAH
jgi:membrane fusion protein